MSNNLKIFSGNSNLPLAREICDVIQIPLGKATVTSFPDGETFVRYDENIRGKDIFIVQSTSCPANHNIMELLIMVDAAKRASAHRITAVIPFYGYSRQDRKDQPRVSITSKLIANLLTSAGVDRVLTLDLHSHQIQGFFDIPVDHLYAAPVFYDYLTQMVSGDNWIVYSPDVGGLKMAASYADMLKCPLGFVAKKRTSATTVEAFNFVGDVNGYNVLLVDDMVETAGTLLAAAKLLRENGAKKVIATVTHAVLNPVGYDRLNSKDHALDQLITTNSTVVDGSNLPITILSVAPLLAQAILNIHGDESLTGLFRVRRKSFTLEGPNLQECL